MCLTETGMAFFTEVTQNKGCSNFIAHTSLYDVSFHFLFTPIIFFSPCFIHLYKHLILSDFLLLPIRKVKIYVLEHWCVKYVDAVDITLVFISCCRSWLFHQHRAAWHTVLVSLLVSEWCSCHFHTLRWACWSKNHMHPHHVVRWRKCFAAGHQKSFFFFF